MQQISNRTAYQNDQIHALRKLSFYQRNARLWMGFVLLFSDLFSIFLSVFLAVQMRLWVSFPLNSSYDKYFKLFPLLLVFIGIYAVMHLYNAVGMSPIIELKNLTIATSLSFILIATFSFLGQTSIEYSRLIFLFAFVLCLVIAPIIRTSIRWILIRRGLWGEAVVILGFGSQGQHVFRYIQKNPHMGMRTVAVINGNSKDVEKQKWNIPFVNFKDLSDFGVRTAILVPNEFSASLGSKALSDLKMGFERMILVTDLDWIGSTALISHDMQGVLGLEVEQNLLDPYQKAAKRLLDLAIVFLSAIFLLPFFLIISLVICIESKGPAIYRQLRIGINRNQFYVYKFRTMFPNADQLLEELLENDCDLCEEWERNHKIKNDPRITRIGKFLRKTSLDELPQLFNILKGEMSLVGPRPIVEDEVQQYKQVFDLYKQVLPGITGMWQISGRSNTSYEYRVQLDEYYIRHWSIWMDIYIIVKTIWAVLKRSGAY
jgi:Undecaprenyl-phosphate galactose phosphotransferase WbaP